MRAGLAGLADREATEAPAVTELPEMRLVEEQMAAPRGRLVPKVRTGQSDPMVNMVRSDASSPSTPWLLGTSPMATL
ncbi:hypothetical protein VY88_22135 [Azospirillum thiophilum]|nr:hypothetical protein VY88_22135 [Azospirillum thiophilum]